MINSRKLEFILYAFVLLALFLLEIHLLDYRKGIEVLRSGTPDEALFFEVSANYMKSFISWDASFFPQGFPGPYGHPFWFLLVAVIGIANLLDLNSVLLAYYVFLSLKYLSCFFWKKTLEQRYGCFQSSIFSLTLLLSPGLFFYGKIISPEYMVMLVFSIATYYMAQKNYNGASSYALLGTYIKILYAPYFLIALTVMIAREYRKIYRLNLTFVVASLLSCLAIIKAGGPIVVLNSILALPTPPLRFDFEFWRDSFFGNPIFTWDQILLLRPADAFPIFLILAPIAANTFLLRLREIVADHFGLFCFLVGSVLLILLLTSKGMIFSWYSFVPLVVAVVCAIFLCVSLRGTLGYVLCAVSMTIGAGQIEQSISAEIQKKKLTLSAYEEAPGLLTAARSLCPSADVIIFDVMIPFDRDKIEGTEPIALSEAVKRSWVMQILKLGKFVVVSHEQSFSIPSAVQQRIYLPSGIKQKVVPVPAYKEYKFSVGSSCEHT
ncbi:hypothetical protein At1D1108_42920 [Agrobacterium tumefaciens]|nr:hypothetical protein At1D1108_42920 [Agrobacterium tumefaciens]